MSESDVTIRLTSFGIQITSNILIEYRKMRKNNEMNCRSRDKDIPTKMNLEIID